MFYIAEKIELFIYCVETNRDCHNSLREIEKLIEEQQTIPQAYIAVRNASTSISAVASFASWHKNIYL